MVAGDPVHVGGKGAGAIALTTMLSWTRRSAIRRVSWIRPALLAAYE
jgi:hypothetical protein